MDKDKLKEVLDLHKKWLAGEEGGELADLQGADLREADLRGADLQRADLREASLRGADLRMAFITECKLSSYSIVPEEGSFIAWKKLNLGSIARLRIPEDARRISIPTSRKCRSDRAVVLEIFGEGTQGTHMSLHNGQEYRAGMLVYADSFNDDIREECTNGIHFFLTRKEAEEY